MMTTTNINTLHTNAFNWKGMKREGGTKLTGSKK